MDDLPLEPFFEEPRHLLPEGCQDLLEWILWQEAAAQTQEKQGEAAGSAVFSFQEIVLPMPGAPKRITKRPQTIVLPAKVRLSQPVQVGTLASKLGLKFYHIVEALFSRKIFATAEGWINFTTAAAICAELGVVAEKEDFGSLPL